MGGSSTFSRCCGLLGEFVLYPDVRMPDTTLSGLVMTPEGLDMTRCGPDTVAYAEPRWLSQDGTMSVAASPCDEQV